MDYLDMGSCNMIKLPNETSVMVDNNFIREAYKFDYFIQIDLHTVNGLTLKTSQDNGFRNDNQNKKPIANIFLRFQH